MKHFAYLKLSMVKSLAGFLFKYKCHFSIFHSVCMSCSHNLKERDQTNNKIIISWLWLFYVISVRFSTSVVAYEYLKRKLIYDISYHIILSFLSFITLWLPQQNETENEIVMMIVWYFVLISFLPIGK